MTDRYTRGGDEVRALAEAVADVLEERGLVVASAATPGRVLNVTEVAELLGRSRAWVYEHAAELGAFRFGEGPKARIGFSRDVIERWKSARQIRQAAAPRQRPPRRARRRTTATPSSVNLIPYDPSPYQA